MSNPFSPEISWPHPNVMSGMHSSIVEVPQGVSGSWHRPNIETYESSTTPLRRVNVLNIADRAFPTRELAERGIWVARMAMHTDLVNDTGSSGLRIARSAFHMALDATPEEHDIAIVDTDCSGYATEYVRALGEAMASRTLLVLNNGGGPRSADSFQQLAKLWSDKYGIEHFSEGSREAQTEAISNLLDSVPTVERPDLPDQYVRVHSPTPSLSYEYDG